MRRVNLPDLWDEPSFRQQKLWVTLDSPPPECKCFVYGGWQQTARETLHALDGEAPAAASNSTFCGLFSPSANRSRFPVKLAAGRAVTEASGGVKLDTVRAIAETGVNWISVGALTHSAPALDLGLDFD